MKNLDFLIKNLHVYIKSDFALAKEEIDNGIETLAKQQKELQMDKLKADIFSSIYKRKRAPFRRRRLRFVVSLMARTTRATAEREAPGYPRAAASNS